MQKRLENSLIFIWTVSFVATLGSLYFSEVRGYEPCTLCWYQRILMYPIVLISGVALFQKNARIALTTAVFSYCRRKYFPLSLWNSKAQLS